jgi:hypothetical protein
LETKFTAITVEGVPGYGAEGAIADKETEVESAAHIISIYPPELTSMLKFQLISCLVPLPDIVYTWEEYPISVPLRRIHSCTSDALALELISCPENWKLYTPALAVVSLVYNRPVTVVLGAVWDGETV